MDTMDTAALNMPVRAQKRVQIFAPTTCICILEGST